MGTNEIMQQNYDKCVEVAQEALDRKGFVTLSAVAQVKNIFNYASTNEKFQQIVTSDNNKVQAELRNRIQVMCELGLDTAKSRKLVYVKTRNVNLGTKQEPVWLLFPEITESYHALIHILIRTKTLKNIVCLHTYQNYKIDYSGVNTEIPIVKSWETSPKERGDYTGVFVVLVFHSGLVETSYHHYADIVATHRKFSKSAETWRDHVLAMVAKSAIMEAIRYIPVFDDVLATLINDIEQSQNWEQEAEYEKITPAQVIEVKSALIAQGVDEVAFMRYLKQNRCQQIKDINTQFFTRVMAMINPPNGEPEAENEPG